LIWSVIAILAIANGGLREYVLAPVLGARLALPVSGMILCAIVLVVTSCCFRLIAGYRKPTYLLIGLQWVLMTLMFEAVSGHWVAGKTWPQLLQVLNPAQGDLFVVVLAVSLISPLVVARIRRAW